MPAAPRHQPRDGRVQLGASSCHYAFNLAWLKQLPEMPKP